MHFNENVEKEQAVTKAGEKRWQVSYPKYKKDGSVIKAVRAKCTYGGYSILCTFSCRNLCYVNYLCLQS